MTHTAGPWHVYETSSPDWPGVETTDISIVVWGQPHRDDGGVRGASRSEAIANAHLISAAPDMLSALHICLTALSDSLGLAKATGFSVAETSAVAALAAADAALLKAEGK